jgi:hypothetical protein
MPARQVFKGVGTLYCNGVKTALKKEVSIVTTEKEVRDCLTRYQDIIANDLLYGFVVEKDPSSELEYNYTSTTGDKFSVKFKWQEELFVGI